MECSIWRYRFNGFSIIHKRFCKKNINIHLKHNTKSSAPLYLTSRIWVALHFVPSSVLGVCVTHSSFVAVGLDQTSYARRLCRTILCPLRGNKSFDIASSLRTNSILLRLMRMAVSACSVYTTTFPDEVLSYHVVVYTLQAETAWLPWSGRNGLVTLSGRDGLVTFSTLYYIDFFWYSNINKFENKIA